MRNNIEAHTVLAGSKPHQHHSLPTVLWYQAMVLQCLHYQVHPPGLGPTTNMPAPRSQTFICACLLWLQWSNPEHVCCPAPTFHLSQPQQSRLLSWKTGVVQHSTNHQCCCQNNRTCVHTNKAIRQQSPAQVVHLCQQWGQLTNPQQSYMTCLSSSMFPDTRLQGTVCAAFPK